MRIACIVLAVLALSTPAHADWTQPCFVEQPAYADGAYFRILAQPSILRGWSVATTTLTNLRRTYAITATRTLTQSLAFQPYTIQATDLELRFSSPTPFQLSTCAPGAHPFIFLPLLRGGAIGAPVSRTVVQ